MMTQEMGMSLQSPKMCWRSIGMVAYITQIWASHTNYLFVVHNLIKSSEKKISRWCRKTQNEKRTEFREHTPFLLLHSSDCDFQEKAGGK